MQFKIIVAVCKNNGIGCNNTLPWKIKEDLQHFSKVTKGNGHNAIVMGKNTWESIGSKPLPKRDNFILSTTMNTAVEHNPVAGNPNSTNQTFVCRDINEVEIKCREKNYENVWIIGGESIYKQFLARNVVSECIVTYIDSDFSCDTFFPSLSSPRWNVTKLEYMENSSNYDVTIKQYKYVV